MERHKVLEVKGLTKSFLRMKGLTRKVIGVVKAVDHVSFDIAEGESLGLVGESGCGKTTAGRCILRAIEPDAGQLHFRYSEDEDSVDLMALSAKQLRLMRRHMGLIFQDPFSSLNPRMNVLQTIGDPLIINKVASKRYELELRVAGLLRDVGLDPAHMHRYPHAFSGGQRQRIAIARELALNPRLIVADEPVSALDVSVQAQVLNLLVGLQRNFGLTYLFVAHDLAVVEYICQRIAVMYVGKIVELAPANELLKHPLHPYTETLLKVIPKADPLRKRRERAVGGEVPDPANPPTGCYFHPRCTYAKEVCVHEPPPLVNHGSDEAPHYSACHFAGTLNLKGVAELSKEPSE